MTTAAVGRTTCVIVAEDGVVVLAAVAGKAMMDSSMAEVAVVVAVEIALASSKAPDVDGAGRGWSCWLINCEMSNC